MLNSALYAKWRMRTSAMRLAGGPEAQADLFASRLHAFLRATAEPVVVSVPTRMIVAWDEAARQMLILAAQMGPLVDEPELAYELCGYDLARGLGPNAELEPTIPSDPFRAPLWRRAPADQRMARISVRVRAALTRTNRERLTKPITETLLGNDEARILRIVFNFLARAL